jgi:hypothetical protein
MCAPEGVRLGRPPELVLEIPQSPPSERKAAHGLYPAAGGVHGTEAAANDQLMARIQGMLTNINANLRSSQEIFAFSVAGDDANPTM